MLFSIQSFRCTHNTITYIHGAFPLAFPTPCWFSFAPLNVPFVSPSTYLAPSSCDRNRPPPSQVACKLTPFAPPFTQLTHPSQIPRTPPAPRLTMTTSGIFRLLLIGTLTFLLSFLKGFFSTSVFLFFAKCFQQYSVPVRIHYRYLFFMFFTFCG